MIKLFEDFEDFQQEDIAPTIDLSKIPTWLEFFSSMFEGRRVRIVLGHPDDNNYIEGDVRGFDNGTKYHGKELFYILLENVSCNNEYQQYAPSYTTMGHYDKHLLDPLDRIEII